jgi:hypothetical protein
MKRWEVSNGDVTEKSRKCDSYIMARMPTLSDAAVAKALAYER